MKHILITGSNRGIGLAVAQRFLEDPEYIVFGSLRTGNHPISHDRFSSLSLDLSSPASIQQFVRNLEHLKIDILINNAGILPESGTETSIEREVLRKTFEVNLFGTVELTEHIIPLLSTQAQIVNLSSSWGSFDNPDFDHRFPSYRMSKAALNMYSKILEKRLQPQSIRVTSFDPGWVQTDMGGAAAPKTPASVAEEIYTLCVLRNP